MTAGPCDRPLSSSRRAAPGSVERSKGARRALPGQGWVCQEPTRPSWAEDIPRRGRKWSRACTWLLGNFQGKKYHLITRPSTANVLRGRSNAIYLSCARNAIISLSSGTQAPMTDEEEGGTGDVEASKNSKDRTAGPRPQEGCLCRKGARAGSSESVDTEAGGGQWAQSVAQSRREPPSDGFSEWNRLPCSTVSPGAGNARAGARRPALMETRKSDCPGGGGMRSLACFPPDLRLHWLHGEALLLSWGLEELGQGQ